MYPVKSFEVEAVPVHYTKGTGQENDHVEHADIVHLAVRYMYEIGDGVLCVHFRVHLYGSFCLAELHPGIKAQAGVDVEESIIKTLFFMSTSSWLSPL